MPVSTASWLQLGLRVGKLGLDVNPSSQAHGAATKIAKNQKEVQ
jgi:hypothetical protein